MNRLLCSLRRLLSGIMVASATSLISACHQAPDAGSRFVAAWAYTLYGTIRAERLSPPVASRLMAYASTALYSGFAAVDSTAGPSLAGRVNGLPSLPTPDRHQQYDAALTALAAERTVLDSLFRDGLPTTRATLLRLADSLRSARLAVGIRTPERDASEDLGRRIGNAILEWAHADGFEATRGRHYTPPVGLAMWVNDAPPTVYTAQNQSGASSFVPLNNPGNVMQSGSVSDRALILDRPKDAHNLALPSVNMAGLTEPYWGELRPFFLKRSDECALPEPPAYSTDTTSRMYRDAMEVHSVLLKVPPERLAAPGDIETPSEREREVQERRATALLWADNAGESGTPVGHWTSIGAQMINEHGMQAGRAARVFALTSLSQADAFIAAWAYKFKYTLIRPRTYIRRVIDPAWEPAIPTPPFPEYPSAHSTQSAAAAVVLARFFGDSTAFTDSTGMALGNPPRAFASFAAAAHEAGQSRIYGGIHFQYGNLGGRTLGECIGARVVERGGLHHD